MIDEDGWRRRLQFCAGRWIDGVGGMRREQRRQSKKKLSNGSNNAMGRWETQRLGCLIAECRSQIGERARERERVEKESSVRGQKKARLQSLGALREPASEPAREGSSNLTDEFDECQRR